MSKKIVMALLGAGRIGSIHATTVAQQNDVELRYVVDVNERAGRQLAEKLNATFSDTNTVMADGEVDAVIIATATDTHADLIELAANSGKAIFCEKPVDLNFNKVERCLKVVAEQKVPLALGFNRRFDPNFSALQQQLKAGRIGELEMVSITSRDPSPPPLEYIKVSGGLFRDMMIHDFDMARWLLGEEPVEVFATGSCLVDPDIAVAGDIDTAMVILKTASGKLCQISNSRRASYGYDQRVEVFGSEGMLRVENETSNRLECFDSTGVIADKPLYFFLERYAQAYRQELEDFVSAIRSGDEPLVTGNDGLEALRLANAAFESYKSGIPVVIKA
ncbi:inositol 2-dehydrogenase [Oceanicoccus sp. KOV_DT_Chl]|uniref:inositol 2-dehydrogenase n=1 Tax=Oceanicoccus sp. KOV_DT_Chl TaxID=1904639 RepID=UPI000C7BF402|nr:inositol 2-dehydrogenase [Oceanicoccus sp. KOV_DT_Chl]